ncbi:MAG: nuclease [Planctomycetaceae bacterium]|nr:nuclease [Planctomycetaceae bacterium]
MPTTATVTALQQASVGLTFQSETDAPWTAFNWPTATGEVTGEAVQKLGKHKAGSPVSEKPLDEFFAPLVADLDWYGDEEKAIAQQYQVLLGVIKGVLSAPKVVKVGAKNVSVYVVGKAKEGGWAGLMTKAVET